MPPASPTRRNPDAKRRLWAERLARFRNSRLTVAQFCSDEGVSVPSFYSWKRTLERDDRQDGPTPAVVPIRLTPAATHPPAIELSLPSGAVFRFPIGTPTALIAALLHAVEGRPC